jgi:solute carrier family 25 phosphate transporter 3
VLKLRLQTDPACAARGLTGALRAVVRTEGVGALFKGLSAICLRQLPYTAVKLVSYELFAQLLLAAAVKAGFEAGSARLERARPVLALGSGLLAGACAALASQPADLLLTRICGGASVAALSSCVIADNVVDQVRYLFSIGLRECYAGVGPRLTMVASMTAVQFLLYDLLRLRLGVAGPVPG